MIGEMVTWNRKIIKVYNSCNTKLMVDLFGEVIQSVNRLSLLTKKYYIWNIFRPRDFYRAASEYVIQQLKIWIDTADTQAQYNADQAIMLILKTAKSYEIKGQFIFGIIKQVPIMTTATLEYTSRNRVKHMLDSGKDIVTDDHIAPLMEYIKELKKENDDLRMQIEALQAIAE